MKHTPITEIKVGLEITNKITPVGRLALNDGKIYFEYDRDFLQSSLELSPLKLPRQAGLQTFDRYLFEGLSGLFNDSLPDGWGRLLLDRSARLQGILPDELSPLDRLAHVGKIGMGALTYEPDQQTDTSSGQIDLDALAVQTQEVMDGEASEVLQELISLNGSSAGVRPKALIGLDAERINIIHGTDTTQTGFEPWLVKFSNSEDGSDAGAIEHIYAIMAKDAGLEMMPTHLFSAQKGAGYFATKRFDRDNNKRIHTHSACGLLHSDFRTPSLDYADLLKLTSILTRDVREVEKMFRLAVFNVLAHNRDDHSKNFSFLMNETGEWKLSPAYDLTFSSGPRGEQSTMVMGEGKNPADEQLTKLGIEANINQQSIVAIVDQTQAALSQWRALAIKYSVSKANIKLIDERINKS
ncbi:MAG: type II toxin-antitoxin system HipA family toxin [Rhizobiales bacterium]|nr:type II toxin-antitoxin system HipA family toxin [Hyphomicrobiales bacterium]NRB13238.1 type II toxin-antitoxin system HipA family toxin [Hyphomicrobiales bacterium]